MLHELHAAIAVKINDKATAITDELASGGARNIEEYRRMTGRLQGLRDAAEIINECFRREAEDE